VTPWAPVHTSLAHRSMVAVVLVLSLIGAACSSGGDDSAPAPTEGDVSESAAPSSSTTADLPSTSSESTGRTEVIDNSGPVRGGTLRVALQTDPTEIVGWTPWDHICAWACRNVSDTVLEALAVHRFDGSVVPFLAESIEPNESLVSWTVVLRDGITFSDGTPLNAPSVKAAHDEFLNTGKVTEGLLRDARIIALTVVDDRTVMYDLSGPNAGFPDVLTGPIGRVFSVEAARTDPATFLRAPVGSGPFVFESWAIGEPATVVRNPSYWGRDAEGEALPYLERIEFQQVADESERLDRVRLGDADVIQTRAPRTIQQALDLDLRVFRRTEDNASVLLFNTLEPPFDDQRVRRALALATDQTALIDAAGEADLASPATQWWGPDSIWFSPRAQSEWPTTDVNQAVSLLAEYANDPLRSDLAELSSPINVRLLCTDDLRLQNMAREVERQWEATGLVAVEVDTIARGGLISRVVGSVSDRPSFSGDFSVTCWRVGGESEPYAQLSAALGPVKTSPLNFPNIESARFTELVALLESATNMVARRTAVEEIMVTMASEVPLIYIGYTSSAIAGLQSVQGLALWTLPDGTVIDGQLNSVGRYVETWIDVGP
jgi:peptide/nickel transport system substrate-binding protein